MDWFVSASSAMAASRARWLARLHLYVAVKDLMLNHPWSPPLLWHGDMELEGGGTSDGRRAMPSSSADSGQKVEAIRWRSGRRRTVKRTEDEEWSSWHVGPWHVGLAPCWWHVASSDETRLNLGRGGCLPGFKNSSFLGSLVGRGRSRRWTCYVLALSERGVKGALEGLDRRCNRRTLGVVPADGDSRTTLALCFPRIPSRLELAPRPSRRRGRCIQIPAQAVFSGSEHLGPVTARALPRRHPTHHAP